MVGMSYWLYAGYLKLCPFNYSLIHRRQSAALYIIRHKATAMRSIRLMLTVNPDMHAELAKRAQSRFMTIQEYFLDIARKDLLSEHKGRVGRPPKKKREYEDYFSKR
jgi:hypothetical protein